jgi:hypothetical protein
MTTKFMANDSYSSVVNPTYWEKLYIDRYVCSIFLLKSNEICLIKDKR